MYNVAAVKNNGAIQVKTHVARQILAFCRQYELENVSINNKTTRNITSKFQKNWTRKEGL